jgi:hypothetical protein
MFNKKIEFIITDENMKGVWPKPTPAMHAIPPEYKKLKRFVNNDLHKSTVKTCVPFLDALTTGYMLYFDQDYVIDPVGDDFSIAPSDREHMEYHANFQLPPEWKPKVGAAAGKIINKWLIKTPPGYSCLFVHPLNHLLNDKIHFLSGVVDTDGYINTINFPLVILDKTEQFILKKGDPMIQVIPFKREPWKMWSGFYLEKLHSKTHNIIKTGWVDKYKKLFWKKKGYR